MGMSVEEAGRKGGLTTRDKHGTDFYSAIGTRGAKAVLQKYGPEHYSDMGKKGGRRIKQLVELAKQEG